MEVKTMVLILLCAFSFFGFLIAVYLFFFCKILMGRTLGIMFSSSSVATSAYIMQLSASSVSDMFQWVIVRYVSLLIFALTMTIFVFDYTKISIPIKSWRFFILGIIPAIALFLLAVNPNSPRIYSQAGISITNIQEIDKTIGPLFIFMQTYVTGLLIFLIYLLLKNIRSKTKLGRINLIFIASGLLLYVSTHLLSLGGKLLLFGTYSSNIFTYFPSSLLVLWGVQRYQLADIRPIAYNLIFNQLQDGILVVDRRGYLVDFNSAAKEYLAFSGGLSPGKLFDLQKLKIAGLKEFDKVGKEKMLQSEVNGVLCQIMSFGLFDYRGDLYGHLVSIRDISGEVEKEKLKEAEIIRKSAWEERMHLARSLHDSVLQNVGGLIMLAGSARQCLDEQLPHEIATLVGQIETGARLAYQDLRLLIDELQLNSAAETEFDLLKTLAAKIDVLKAQGSSDIVFEAPSNLLLDAGRQREVFYIIIEALNNALKYADAKIVRVRIWHSEGVIVGEIEDGGNGFDLRQKRNTGMGMQNMQSRARLMGGQLAIISVPGEGTRVRLEIPVSLPISSEIDKREQPI